MPPKKKTIRFGSTNLGTIREKVAASKPKAVVDPLPHQTITTAGNISDINPFVKKEMVEGPFEVGGRDYFGFRSKKRLNAYPVIEFQLIDDKHPHWAVS
jgi:hypothetical protein